MNAFRVSLVLALAACATPRPQPDLRPRAVEPFRARPGATYRLTVPADSRLGGDFAVSPEGTLALPLCGPVKVAGLAIGDLEMRVRECLSTWLKDPALSVRLLDSGQFVTFVGDLSARVHLEEGLTLIGALLQAGGEGIGTELSRVELVGDTQRAVIDVNEIATGNARDVPLQPGDVVQLSCRSGHGCGGRHPPVAASRKPSTGTATALLTGPADLSRALQTALPTAGLGRADVRLTPKGDQLSLEVTCETAGEAQARCTALVLATTSALASEGRPARQWLNAELDKTRQSLRALETSRREVPFDDACAEQTSVAGLEVCSKARLAELEKLTPEQACKPSQLCTIATHWLTAETDVRELETRYGGAHPTLRAAIARRAALASWFDRQRDTERAALKSLLAKLASADRKKPDAAQRARYESASERLRAFDLTTGAADDLPLALRLAALDFNTLALELDALLARYTEQHPEVLALEARLAAMKADAAVLAREEAELLKWSPASDPRAKESAQAREKLLHVLELLELHTATVDLAVVEPCTPLESP